MNADQYRARNPEGHDHEWEPVSFGPFDSQPSLDGARVYFICRGCNGWTYDIFRWVGHYMGGDQEWEDE